MGVKWFVIVQVEVKMRHSNNPRFPIIWQDCPTRGYQCALQFSLGACAAASTCPSPRLRGLQRPMIGNFFRILEIVELGLCQFNLAKKNYNA